MAKVSVIIPAYNAEKTLRRCVESILQQSFRDLEVILVDDGSRDGTPALCDALAAEDSRVRVIHKPNGGVSAARNTALDAATGEYVLFADSDDWLAEESIAAMVGVAQTHGVDLVIADYYRVFEGAVQAKSRIRSAGPMGRPAFLHAFTDAPSAFYFGVLWNKLYRREIIEAHRLRLDTHFSWCEDLLFNMDYYRHVTCAYALRQPVYYYVRSLDSLSMQRMNLFRLGRIRLHMFAAYRRFAREALSPAAYRAWKPRALRFFYAGLIDEFVLPWEGKTNGGCERRLFESKSPSRALPKNRCG